MPFRVFKTANNYWKIKKPEDNHTYAMNFKDKKSAVNMAKRWISYRKGTPIVKGNWVGHSKNARPTHK